MRFGIVTIPEPSKNDGRRVGTAIIGGVDDRATTALPSGSTPPEGRETE